MSSTAIIVPCYNEENRLLKDEFLYFVKIHDDIDFWFIDDGSTDGTGDLLKNISKENPTRLFCIVLQKNQGKAEAVRQAFLEVNVNSRYDYLGFIDADLSAPLREILPLLNLAITRKLLLVSGARVKLAGCIIERNRWRHYFSRIFATYYLTLLKLPNYDTQCGLKIFDRSVVPILFSKHFISKWLFDIELFLRMQDHFGKVGFLKFIAEVPLSEWKEVKDSKLKISDFLKVPFEVIRIRKAYKR